MPTLLLSLRVCVRAGVADDVGGGPLRSPSSKKVLGREVVLSGSLLDFQRRRSRGHDPGVLLAPRLLPLSEKKWYLKVDFWLLCFSLWHSILVYREA